jgi:hypothetical protein
MNNGSISLFDFVTGWMAFLSFFVVTFCIATLRCHVDEEEIRKEEIISALFRSPIPPEHVLTDSGKRRVKIAKIAIGVCMTTVAAIVIRNQVLGR